MNSDDVAPSDATRQPEQEVGMGSDGVPPSDAKQDPKQEEAMSSGGPPREAEHQGHEAQAQSHETEHQGHEAQARSHEAHPPGCESMPQGRAKSLSDSLRGHVRTTTPRAIKTGLKADLPAMLTEQGTE